MRNSDNTSRHSQELSETKQIPLQTRRRRQWTQRRDGVCWVQLPSPYHLVLPPVGTSTVTITYQYQGQCTLISNQNRQKHVGIEFKPRNAIWETPKEMVNKNIKFDVQGSAHRKFVPKYHQEDAALHSFFLNFCKL